jgi:hypothetical protein
MHVRSPQSLALSIILPISLMGMSVAPAHAQPAHRTPSHAHASRTEQVRETVSAKLTASHGATELTERGSVHGTFNCPVTINIKLSYTKASIGFSCGSVLAGNGTTAFYVSGETGHFHGTLVITRGSGHYHRSAGSRLNIAGTLRRGSYVLSAQVSGPMSV